MPHHQPGSRVVALREATADTVHLFGRGVYLGYRYLPTRQELLNDPVYRQHQLDQIAAAAHRLVSLPREEWAPKGKPSGLDLYGYPLNEPLTVETVAHSQLKGILTNACIELRDKDDRPVGHVYGEQCWWTDEATYATRFAGRTEITVPLPPGQDGPAPTEDAFTTIARDAFTGLL